MVKSEFIAQITGKFNKLSEADVELGVNRILEIMSESLSKGKRIEIRGFGSFSLHYRQARSAHNPKTGAKVTTKPKHAPYFKPGKEVRDQLNSARAQKIAIIPHE